MIKFLKDRILPLFMVAWLGGLLPACINEGEDTAGITEDGGFCISIAISAGNTPSARALFDDDGILAENYIDVQDNLKIYAYTETENTAQSTFIAQIYPSTEPLAKIDKIGDTYYLTAELSNTLFDDNQQFKLVAIANWRTGVGDEVPGTLGELQTASRFYYYDALSGASTWSPSIEDKRGIPMFGIQHVDLSTYDKKIYNNANRYPLGTVSMLRALAKIEIVNATNPDVAIDNVQVLRYNSDGFRIPYLNTIEGDGDTGNVNAPSIPTQTETTIPLSFTKQGDIYVGYLPEYALTSANRSSIIQVRAGGNYYPLSLSPYQDGVPVAPAEGEYWWDALLRNHIYRYTITGVGAQAQVTVRVTDWEDADTEEWTYEQNVGIADGGHIEWTGAQSDNTASARLIVNPDGTPAVGTFNITTPVNATWHAYLITQEGDPNAFTFVDEEGKSITEPTGIIDSSSATVRIKCTNSTTAQQNVARLQIMVEMADGRWMVADVCEGEPEYYTIIQNQS